MDNNCEYANLGRFRKGGLTSLFNSIIINLYETNQTKWNIHKKNL